MDFLIEFLGELLIEGSMELATNKKISKWIRYPLIMLLSIFYSIIIFEILYLGLKLMHENIIISMILILISILLLIGTFIVFYRKCKNNN